MPKPDKKLDDEYFRVYITMGGESWHFSGPPVERGSSFERSGGLKGKLQDDYILIRETAELNPLRFTDGKQVPSDLLPLIQPFDYSH
jgi:hypothetical protein